jgi:hypothetical protein
MKVEGQLLQSILRRQIEAVRIVDESGRDRRGISARYAADLVLDQPYIGYGKNGVIEFLKHHDADRPPPFATRWDLRNVMAQYPKRPPVQLNHQPPGAKAWVQQPTRAKTGVGGQMNTIHFKR